MKVTKIHLNDYLNFKKGLSIDLTYPIDHPEEAKRGKPLEKVCFIGQSGTGKTTILNLIKFFAFEDQIDPGCLDQDLLFNENVGIEFIVGDKYNYSKWSKGNPSNKDQIENLANVELNYKGENGMENTACKDYISQHFFKEKKVKLISFPFDAIKNFNRFIEPKQEYLAIIKKPEDEKKSNSQIRNEYLSKVVWNFSIDDINWIWEIVIDNIKEYEPDYFKKLNEFLSKSKEDKINQSKYYEEFELWQKENENPLKKIVQICCDKILNKFNLKVNTEIVIETEGKRKFPRIQQLNDNVEIPNSFLSTGTIQILVTAIPLSVLNIDNAIILFDEPERSLFPDSQIGLISEYTKILPNSQFFFATHSPIVASAFEPCERIILDFNDLGKVHCRKGIAPEGDDPNDLLYQDFGMSNIHEKKGKESFDRYIELKTLIHAEKDTLKKEQLMNELLELGNNYRFGNEK